MKGRTFETCATGLVLVGVGLLINQLPAGSKLFPLWPWPVVLGGLTVLGAVATRLRHRKTARFAVLGIGLCVAGGWFATGTPPSMPGRELWLWPVLTGGVLLAVTTVMWWSRRGGSSAVVGRWSRRSRRNAGVASAWSVFRVASRFAVRRKAKVLRPSVRELSVWRRLWVPTRQYATRLAKVGWWWVWSPVEDVTLRLGGPRQGKTGELAGRILDAPGAVIATSTRTDLITLTSALRKRIGPISVFNPSGVGDLESTMTFDPLSGCDIPKAAMNRATDLLSASAAPGGSSADREFWTGQARRVLPRA